MLGVTIIGGEINSGGRRSEGGGGGRNECGVYRRRRI
jgi:hypothetical protein